MLHNNRPSSHPRRPPAHLSVSLKHDHSPPSAGPSRGVQDNIYATSPKPQQLSNAESGDSGNGQRWFDNSNKNPALGAMDMDSDPPYFLKRSNSSTSESDHPRQKHANPQPFPGFRHMPATNDSSGDDFRSVIDDLTIQNKKLKERLRKYERSYNPHLDNEKLFEVKVHGLPPHKRRELEETLRSFASSVDGLRDSSSDARRFGKKNHSSASLERSSFKNPPSSSTSNSRPVDSAYASMSTSEPKQGSKRNHVSFGQSDSQSRTQEQKIESYLHEIPEGLLSKHYPAMTEKGKRKLVVRRLEQLFTGKGSSIAGPHSQPLQQQEISRSAAKADREAIEGYGQRVISEGVREAHILDKDLEVYTSKGSKLEQSGSSGSSGDDAENRAPEQRPTRPLDLDPERAQIPMDNMQYIRHLGLDSPRLLRSESAVDSEGWVYFNLLVSMAQLHMLNVTPDFIRSAVAEVSEKFELSPDGRKLRWRGGSEGTKLSSDSGNDSRTSPNDSSDSLDESQNKRRRFDGGRWQDRAPDMPNRQFESRPVPATGIPSSDQVKSGRTHHYKPLFRHKLSSSEEEASMDESDNQMEWKPLVEHSHGTTTFDAHLTPDVYHSNLRGRKRSDDGMLVFYSGAPFCIDLSAERQGISTPSHATSVGRDGYSNHTHDALGCKPFSGPPRSSLHRTPSGSRLNFRPFKDYSKSGEIFQSQRPKTPDLVNSGDESEDDLVFTPEWSSLPPIAPTLPLDMEVSGLGGTCPADHFHIVTETHHSKLDKKSRARLSKFSAPSAKRRRFMHNIPRSSLDSFRDPIRNADSITLRLASLRADSPPIQEGSEAKPTMPVHVKVVSARVRRIDPSPLPPPAMWYNQMSSSEESSNTGSTDSSSREIARLRQRIPWMHPAVKSSSRHVAASTSRQTTEDSNIAKVSNDNSPSEMDEDSDDESIDMLAAAREIDPEAIAAQEAEFEIEATRRLEQELPLGSSAATVDGGSGQCGSGFESSGSSMGGSDSDDSSDDD